MQSAPPFGYPPFAFGVLSFAARERSRWGWLSRVSTLLDLEQSIDFAIQLRLAFQLMSPPIKALRVVNHIPAMIAYWDANQRCVFANLAYLEWFGRSPEEMKGITLEQLLGPDLYGKNLPFIKKALAGERQLFERQIPLPSGDIRESIATYTPDIVAGVVQGFSVHVADVTCLRKREMALQQIIAETISVLERTKHSFRSKELGALRKRLEELQRDRRP